MTDQNFSKWFKSGWGAKLVADKLERELPTAPPIARIQSAAGCQSVENNAQESLKFLLERSMSNETQHFFEFGRYRVDPARRLLLRGQDPVALTPKAFETL